MSDKESHLWKGHQYYESQQYAQALRHYSQALIEETLELNRLMIEATIAVIYMHLCNYTEAHGLFCSLANKL